MGKAQVGDALQRVPASVGGDESSTSSVAIHFCATAGTFIPHASSSLQIAGGSSEYPTAPFARPGVCTHVSYRGVTSTGKSERGRGREQSWGAGTETGTGSGAGTGT